MDASVFLRYEKKIGLSIDIVAAMVGVFVATFFLVDYRYIPTILVGHIFFMDGFCLSFLSWLFVFLIFRLFTRPHSNLILQIRQLLGINCSSFVLCMMVVYLTNIANVNLTFVMIYFCLICVFMGIHRLLMRLTLYLFRTLESSKLLLLGIPHTINGLILKRLTDILISVIALTCFMIIFIGVAVAIKLDDRGPIIFTQERVGLNGTPFTMYKFRSMCVGAEARRRELLHLNEMSGPVFKVRNDPRVTRVGRLIRKMSIDELPQLWNVLKGDMSLVGPRPPLVSEVAEYELHHRRRLCVKPGITCLWQISGRNHIDFHQWMDLDLQYIDTWSYLQDIRILLKTIPVVVRGNGAS